MFDFAEWLKGQMRKRGWDALDLEVESGLSKVTIQYYLRGIRKPTLASFEVLLETFGQHLKIEDN